MTMADAESDPDPETLAGALHGEVVGGPQGFVCDYCSAPISIDGPVCYEAIRVVDLANFESVVNPPDGWVLDAARCGDCARTTIAPATDGYDEVLLEVAIARAGRALSLDASTLSVLDYSPTDDGYYPPLFTVSNMPSTVDYGFLRWIRKLGFLTHPDVSAEAKAPLWRTIDRSLEVPPQVAELRPE